MPDVENPQARILSLFLSDMMDGNLICSQGVGCKSDHKFAHVWKTADEIVVISSASGCIYATVDPSGNALYSVPLTRRDGNSLSYQTPNSSSSPKENQSVR